MKRFAITLAVTVALASSAFAADVITLKAKNGNVSFDHKKHQAAAECKVCHVKGAGKIEGFGKDSAHKMCKGCHEEKKAGPVKCGECHKK